MAKNILPTQTKSQPLFPEPTVEYCVRVSNKVRDRMGVTKIHNDRVLIRRRFSRLFNQAGKLVVDRDDNFPVIESSDNDNDNEKNDVSDPLEQEDEHAYLICDEIHNAIYGKVYRGIVLHRSSTNDIWQTTLEHCAIKEMTWEKIKQGRQRFWVENPHDEIAAMQHVLKCLAGTDRKNTSVHDIMREGKVILPLDLLYDDLHLYIVTPLCTGGELFTLLQERQTFSEEESRYLLRNILDGLESLQKVGLCHRDISLENILVDHEKAYIIDMGMCLRMPFLDEEEVDANALRNIDYRQIGNNRCLIDNQPHAGKLKYMSPEVYSEKPFDGYAADMWSVGVCLYTMLTGANPWKKPAKHDAYFKYISNGNLSKLLRQWGIHLSPNAIDLLQEMLRLDPRDRLNLQQVREHPWMNGDAKNPMNN